LRKTTFEKGGAKTQTNPPLKKVEPKTQTTFRKKIKIGCKGLFLFFFFQSSFQKLEQKFWLHLF